MAKSFLLIWPLSLIKRHTRDLILQNTYLRTHSLTNLADFRLFIPSLCGVFEDWECVLWGLEIVYFLFHLFHIFCVGFLSLHFIRKKPTQQKIDTPPNSSKTYPKERYVSCWRVYCFGECIFYFIDFYFLQTTSSHIFLDTENSFLSVERSVMKKVVCPKKIHEIKKTLLKTPNSLLKRLQP